MKVWAEILNSGFYLMVCLGENVQLAEYGITRGTIEQEGVFKFAKYFARLLSSRPQIILENLENCKQI